MLRWFRLIVQLIIRKVEAGSLAAETCSFHASCESPSEPGQAGLPNTSVYLGAGQHFHRPIHGSRCYPLSLHSTQLDFIMSQNGENLSCLGYYLIKCPSN